LLDGGRCAAAARAKRWSDPACDGVTRVLLDKPTHELLRGTALCRPVAKRKPLGRAACSTCTNPARTLPESERRSRWLTAAKHTTARMDFLIALARRGGAFPSACTRVIGHWQWLGELSSATVQKVWSRKCYLTYMQAYSSQPARSSASAFCLRGDLPAPMQIYLIVSDAVGLRTTCDARGGCCSAVYAAG
jgi:hypothetical protein